MRGELIGEATVAGIIMGIGLLVLLKVFELTCAGSSH